MAYGKNDPRVHINHGFDMERALKKAGKTFEMIIEGDEGHGFRLEEKRIAFFTRVDAFLKEYVPPPGGRVDIGPARVIDSPAKPKGRGCGFGTTSRLMVAARGGAADGRALFKRPVRARRGGGWQPPIR